MEVKSIKRTNDLTVGDLFYTSWGWEQTNVNFFQVVELVGKSSVRVREVWPEILREEAVGPMAEERVYAIPETIIPAADRATFVEDNERGDLRRVSTKWGTPMIKVGKKNCYQETARPYHGEKLYVSWYA